MKKLFFLLLILLTIIDVIYASFPVLDSPDILNVDSVVLYESPYRFFYIFLGVLVGLFSIMLLFLPLFLLFIPNQYFRRGVYIGLMILSPFILLALIFWISGSGLTIM